MPLWGTTLAVWGLRLIPILCAHASTLVSGANRNDIELIYHRFKDDKRDDVKRNFYPGDKLPLWHEELEPQNSLLDILAARTLTRWSSEFALLSYAFLCQTSAVSDLFSRF